MSSSLVLVDRALFRESLDSVARKRTMMLEKMKRHLGVAIAEAAEGSDTKRKALRQEQACGTQVTMDKRAKPRRAALDKPWSRLV